MSLTAASARPEHPRHLDNRLTFSTAMIPAAATRESVRVDLPAGYKTVARVSACVCWHSGQGRETRYERRQREEKPACCLTVINVCNDGHVTNVELLVHQSTNLLDCKQAKTADVPSETCCQHNNAALSAGKSNLEDTVLMFCAVAHACFHQLA